MKPAPASSLLNRAPCCGVPSAPPTTPPPRAPRRYLRKNYVADITDIQYLAQLPDLRVLWLCDNPCADHPLYRQIVARTLPSIEKLDNLEVRVEARVGRTLPSAARC